MQKLQKFREYLPDKTRTDRHADIQTKGFHQNPSPICSLRGLQEKHKNMECKMRTVPSLQQNKNQMVGPAVINKDLENRVKILHITTTNNKKVLHPL